MRHTDEYSALIRSGVYADYERFLRVRRKKEKGEVVNDATSLSVSKAFYEDLAKCEIDTGIEFGVRYALELCDNLHWQRFHRGINLKERIYSCIKDGTGQFLTLTFSDEVLNSTSEQTRRTYVSRFLKEHSSEYVSNIDFGANNGREHYHAVVKDFDESPWLYGFKKYSKVGFSSDKSLDDFRDDKGHVKEDNTNRMAKYMAKLTNHALKTLGTGKRFIYSRNKGNDTK